MTDSPSDMSGGHYDVIVIGSGSAGQTVAAACAKAKRTVAVIDRQPFGGTCALRGCLPKKALLAGAEAVIRARMLEGRGVSGDLAIDWSALMRHKQSYVESVPEKTVAWMHSAGIDTYGGTARFTGADTLEVDGLPLHGSAIVIATGSTPMELGIPGADEVLTSTDFLSHESMPQRVVFVGGGYISFEFAWLAHLAGAKVTIAHSSGQVLGGFEPALADALADRYREHGIEIVLDAPVQRVDRAAGGGFSVVTPHGSIDADAVFHGAGRVPDLADLDLDAADVEHSRRGVTVDEYLRSPSNPRVWAAGDAAAAGAPLTPVAGAQGEVVAAGILGDPVPFDDGAIPSVVFSDPPVARVGLGTDAASDDRFEVHSFDMSQWYTQSRVGNTAAGAVLVVERSSGLVVGAHLMGVDAAEIINVFAVAIRARLTVTDLRAVTWAYPTLAYDINYLTGRY